jgi:cation diffusion facilitator CzcD-associated flavoprotein CzcO
MIEGIRLLGAHAAQLSIVPFLYAMYKIVPETIVRALGLATLMNFIYRSVKLFRRSVGQVEHGRPWMGDEDHRLKRRTAAAPVALCEAKPVVCIVGAGPAGLSMASRLHAKSIPYVVLEANSVAGSSWGSRYDRLHLHTIKDISALPHFPFPEYFPEFVSAKDLQRYYAACASQLNVKYNSKVVRVSFVKANEKPPWELELPQEERDRWIVETENGETYAEIAALVVCTGQEGTPHSPDIQGASQFLGEIIHSSEYKNGVKWRGKKVLVVGFGNSGSEIALDLWEHGAKPTCLIRSPIHMMPRWLTRIFAHIYSALWWLMRKDDPKHTDMLIQNVVYPLLYKGSDKYNIRMSKSGMLTDLLDRHRAPVQDLGTYELITKGEISVVSHEIQHFSSDGVAFVNEDKTQPFDCVVFSTGFKKGGSPYTKFIPDNICKSIVDSHGVVHSGDEVACQPRLYFVGFDDFMGRLFEMNLETEKICKHMLDKSYVSMIV